MPTAVKFPVPASMLRARAREFEFDRQQALPASERRFYGGNNHPAPENRHHSPPSGMDVVEAIGWKDILGEFEFPEVYSWDADQAPARVMEQLIGQTIGFGMKVTYLKQECLVVDLDVRPDEMYQVMRGSHLDDYWRPLTIVPLKYIDLNA